MVDEYTIKVEAFAPDGTSVFLMTTVGKKENLYSPNLVTPGAGPIIAHLSRVIKDSLA